MTPKQTQLFDAMKDAARSELWEVTGGGSIRYTERDIPTPQYARDARWWEPATYDRHVFVKVVPGRSKWAVFVRVAKAPWVDVSESEVTLTRALEAVENPAALFE